MLDLSRVSRRSSCDDTRFAVPTLRRGRRGRLLHLVYAPSHCRYVWYCASCLVQCLYALNIYIILIPYMHIYTTTTTTTTGQLRRQAERFFPFVDTGVDIDMAGYCSREVEPMGRESEQLHIIALTEYLGLRVAIEYLDGRWVLLSWKL